MSIVTIITLIQTHIKGKRQELRDPGRETNYRTKALLSQLWKSRHRELASESFNLFSYLSHFHLVLLILGQCLLELLQCGFGVHACLDFEGELNA